MHFVEESTDMDTVKKWLTRVNEEQYYPSTIDVLDVFVKVIWPVIVRHALKPGFHIIADDPVRLYGNTFLRSCDSLRSSAIVRLYGNKPAIECDRERLYGN